MSVREIARDDAAEEADVGRGARLTGGMQAAVVLIGGIAPLATDLYVPGFPRVAADLGATATQVQLTLTTFFLGMALGQLVGGPVSDQRGRRRPLLGSLVVLVLTSLACAVVPSVTALMALRFLQGLSGGWAMVMARAMVVDLAHGDALVRAINLIAGVGGIAPIVGPLLGGVILQLASWRASFLVVAGLAATMAAAVTLVVPETLPPDRRHSGEMRELAHAARDVLGQRRFVAYAVVVAFSMGVTFAYVATSAFILQSMNGLSPMLYSVAFAANAVGLAVATLLAGRLAGRVRTRSVIGVGLALTGVVGLVLLAAAISWGMPLWVALIGFFTLMSAQGLVGANAGALASLEVPDHPGTGSAVLGFLQWCMAGVIAPLAGLGGDRTAVPMAVIIIVLTTGSLTAMALTVRRTPRLNT
ncbi:multidrug effflux MFS transporter [Raineyella fluvialis]|uniref:multidrug effflux MFS transporter n=1 Tax=Raineyella fluvialis TaxID=2662261 RepID=UPI001E2B318E|nr:multidrug effflux MFS transporter [Raineyella fluvialis]